jgi:hypothetical protein
MGGCYFLRQIETLASPSSDSFRVIVVIVVVSFVAASVILVSISIVSESR